MSSLDLAGRLAGVVAAQQEMLSVIDDPEGVMQKLVDRAPEITRSSGAVVELIDGSDMVYAAASGAAKPHVGLRLPVDRSLSGTAAREKCLLRCDDSELDPRVDAAACRKIGIRSMVIVPLLDGERSIGALKTFSEQAGAFDDVDAYALQLLAGSASAALMQARAARDRQLSEQRYRMLFEKNVAGVFRTTADGTILDCNDALVRFLGYDSREELMQHQSWELYPERADRERLLARLHDEQSISNTHVHLKKRDGSTLPAIMSVGMIPSADGDQLLGILVEDH